MLNMSDIEKLSKNIDPNNPFTSLILTLYNIASGAKEGVFPDITGHTITKEEREYQTKKLSAWLAYHSLIDFLSTDKYPGDEVSDILKSLWKAKDEVLPNLQEQINKIVEDLTKRNLCLPWMKLSE